LSKKLSGVKPDEVRRVLRDLGFQVMPKRGKGSHESYRHPVSEIWTTLSWKGDVVPTGTLKRILRDIDMTTSEFLKLL
jgi:predicted RNA binding protein YcfA (HicA-like mRNA interferase family)